MTEEQAPTTELATRPAQQLGVLTDEQVDLIKRTIARGATHDELDLFLYQCKRTGLDPMARQIYMVKRWDSKAKKEVMGVQTGIDGYRLIADRTGLYAGNDDPVFGAAKEWKEGNKTYTVPSSASVTVYKIVGGQRCPFTATARFEEYYPGEKQGFMWRTKPHVMLGKCAEALALRKAFPAELSGIYTDAEMQQMNRGRDEHVQLTEAPAVVEPKPAQTTEQDSLPQWVIEAVERYGDGSVIEAAERVRQDLNVGAPIKGLLGVAKATGDPQRRIIKLLETDYTPAQPEDVSTRPDEPGVVEDAEVVVDNPCPQCGAACWPVTQVDGKRRPKWQCGQCEWASWQNEPWNPDKPKRDGLQQEDVAGSESGDSAPPSSEGVAKGAIPPEVGRGGVEAPVSPSSSDAPAEQQALNT